MAWHCCWSPVSSEPFGWAAELHHGTLDDSWGFCDSTRKPPAPLTWASSLDSGQDWCPLCPKQSPCWSRQCHTSWHCQPSRPMTFHLIKVHTMILPVGYILGHAADPMGHAVGHTTCLVGHTVDFVGYTWLLQWVTWVTQWVMPDVGLMISLPLPITWVCPSTSGQDHSFGNAVKTLLVVGALVTEASQPGPQSHPLEPRDPTRSHALRSAPSAQTVATWYQFCRVVPT